jgi:hypothetical protein
MQLVFRKFPPGAAPEPAVGELYVRPHRPEDRDRRDLACLVLECGLEAFPRGQGPTERIVVNDDPTLDDMLAATFLQRLLAGQELPPGCQTFACHAALAREGLKPGSVPLEVSLVGIYLAIRNDGGGDLTDAAVGARFASAWSRLADHVLRAAASGVDPFTTPLFASGAEFARERAFLSHDRDVYRQDVLRGERWRVRLPGGPPEASGLLLRQPTSLLFKYWSRQDEQAPMGGTYLFLAVDWGKGQWVFSTDPVQKLSLLPLAEALREAEKAHDAERTTKDPWFDGKPFGHTLVAAPRAGTVLGEREVLGIVRRWARARPLHAGIVSPRRVAVAGLMIAVLAAGLFAWAPWKRGTDRGGGDGGGAQVDGGGAKKRGMEVVDESPIREEPQEVVLQPGGSQVTFLVTNPNRANRSVRLWVSLQANGQLPVSRVEVQVNEKGFTPVLTKKPGLATSSRLEASLRPGPNPVVIHLDNAGPDKVPLTVKLSWQDNADFKGTLYLLAVGVTEYTTPGYGRLPCAAQDAKSLVGVFQEQQRSELFREVHCKPLIDNEAMKRDILRELAALKKQVTQHDLAVISFSGHGEKDEDEQFYFLPYGYDRSDTLRNSGVSWDDLQAYVGHMPCQVFIIMDTCHSGVTTPMRLRGEDLQGMIEKAVRQFASNPRGVVVMAACLGHQSGLENSDWKHGALTLAVLEGVTGRRWYPQAATTPLPQKGVLSLKALDYYVTQRVKELAGGVQAVVTNHTGNIDLDAIPISTIGAAEGK